MSKIEPGCLAIIRRAIHPENVGRVVVVVEPFTRLESPAWIVEGGTGMISYERDLQRLDNPPDSAADLLLAPLPKQDKVPA